MSTRFKSTRETKRRRRRRRLGGRQKRHQCRNQRQANSSSTGETFYKQKLESACCSGRNSGLAQGSAVSCRNLWRRPNHCHGHRHCCKVSRGDEQCLEYQLARSRRQVQIELGTTVCDKTNDLHDHHHCHFRCRSLRKPNRETKFVLELESVRQSCDQYHPPTSTSHCKLVKLKSINYKSLSNGRQIAANKLATRLIIVCEFYNNAGTDENSEHYQTLQFEAQVEEKDEKEEEKEKEESEFDNQVYQNSIRIKIKPVSDQVEVERNEAKLFVVYRVQNLSLNSNRRRLKKVKLASRMLSSPTKVISSNQNVGIKKCEQESNVESISRVFKFCQRQSFSSLLCARNKTVQLSLQKITYQTDDGEKSRATKAIQSRIPIQISIPSQGDADSSTDKHAQGTDCIVPIASAICIVHSLELTKLAENETRLELNAGQETFDESTLLSSRSPSSSSSSPSASASSSSSSTRNSTQMSCRAQSSESSESTFSASSGSNLSVDSPIVSASSSTCFTASATSDRVCSDGSNFPTSSHFSCATSSSSSSRTSCCCSIFSTNKDVTTFASTQTGRHCDSGRAEFHQTTRLTRQRSKSEGPVGRRERNTSGPFSGSIQCALGKRVTEATRNRTPLSKKLSNGCNCASCSVSSQVLLNKRHDNMISDRHQTVAEHWRAKWNHERSQRHECCQHQHCFRRRRRRRCRRCHCRARSARHLHLWRAWYRRLHKEEEEEADVSGHEPEPEPETKTLAKHQASDERINRLFAASKETKDDSANSVEGTRGADELIASGIEEDNNSTPSWQQIEHEKLSPAIGSPRVNQLSGSSLCLNRISQKGDEKMTKTITMAKRCPTATKTRKTTAKTTSVHQRQLSLECPNCQMKFRSSSCSKDEAMLQTVTKTVDSPPKFESESESESEWEQRQSQIKRSSRNSHSQGLELKPACAGADIGTPKTTMTDLSEPPALPSPVYGAQIDSLRSKLIPAKRALEEERNAPLDAQIRAHSYSTPTALEGETSDDFERKAKADQPTLSKPPLRRRPLYKTIEIEGAGELSPAIRVEQEARGDSHEDEGQLPAKEISQTDFGEEGNNGMSNWDKKEIESANSNANSNANVNDNEDNSNKNETRKPRIDNFKEATSIVPQKNLLCPMDIVWQARALSCTAASLTGDSNSLVAQLAAAARSKSLCVDSQQELRRLNSGGTPRSAGKFAQQKLEAFGEKVKGLTRIAISRIKRVSASNPNIGADDENEPSSADNNNNNNNNNGSANPKGKLFSSSHFFRRAASQRSGRKADKASDKYRANYGPSRRFRINSDDDDALIVPHQLDRFVSISASTLEGDASVKKGGERSGALFNDGDDELLFYSPDGVYIGPGGICSWRQICASNNDRGDVKSRRRIGKRSWRENSSKSDQQQQASQNDASGAASWLNQKSPHTSVAHKHTLSGAGSRETANSSTRSTRPPNDDSRPNSLKLEITTTGKRGGDQTSNAQWQVVGTNSGNVNNNTCEVACDWQSSVGNRTMNVSSLTTRTQPPVLVSSVAAHATFAGSQTNNSPTGQLTVLAHLPPNPIDGPNSLIVEANNGNGTGTGNDRDREREREREHDQTVSTTNPNAAAHNTRRHMSALDAFDKQREMFVGPFWSAPIDSSVGNAGNGSHNTDRQQLARQFQPKREERRHISIGSDVGAHVSESFWSENERKVSVRLDQKGQLSGGDERFSEGESVISEAQKLVTMSSPSSSSSIQTTQPNSKQLQNQKQTNKTWILNLTQRYHHGGSATPATSSNKQQPVEAEQRSRAANKLGAGLLAGQTKSRLVACESSQLESASNRRAPAHLVKEARSNSLSGLCQRGKLVDLSKSTIELNQSTSRMAEQTSLFLSELNSRYSDSSHELTPLSPGSRNKTNTTVTQTTRDSDHWFKRSASKQLIGAGNELAYEQSGNFSGADYSNASQQQQQQQQQAHESPELYGANLRAICVHCQLIAELANHPASSYLNQLLPAVAVAVPSQAKQFQRSPNEVVFSQAPDKDDAIGELTDATTTTQAQQIRCNEQISIRPSVVLTVCSAQSTLDEDDDDDNERDRGAADGSTRQPRGGETQTGAAQSRASSIVVVGGDSSVDSALIGTHFNVRPHRRHRHRSCSSASLISRSSDDNMEAAGVCSRASLTMSNISVADEISNGTCSESSSTKSCSDDSAATTAPESAANSSGSASSEEDADNPLIRSNNSETELELAVDDDGGQAYGDEQVDRQGEVRHRFGATEDSQFIESLQMVEYSAHNRGKSSGESKLFVCSHTPEQQGAREKKQRQGSGKVERKDERKEEGGRRRRRHRRTKKIRRRVHPSGTAQAASPKRSVAAAAAAAAVAAATAGLAFADEGTSSAVGVLETGAPGSAELSPRGPLSQTVSGESDACVGRTASLLEVPANKQARSASLDTPYLLTVPERHELEDGYLDDEDQNYPSKSNRSRSVDISLPTKPGESYVVRQASPSGASSGAGSAEAANRLANMTAVTSDETDSLVRGSSGQKKFIQGEIKVAGANGETRALKLYVNWQENCLNGEHLWIYVGSSSEACYVGENECLKHGPRLCCSACKITAHTSCISILIDKIKFICKHTFKDLTVNNPRHVKELQQQNVIYHHWVHKRTHCGRCKQCTKTFGNTKLPFSSKEIQAITCSWCKVSYHNKENCYTLSALTEPCTLGAHRESIIPPPWILKLPAAGNQQQAITNVNDTIDRNQPQETADSPQLDNLIDLSLTSQANLHRLANSDNGNKENFENFVQSNRQQLQHSNTTDRSNSLLFRTYGSNTTLMTDTSGYMSTDGGNVQSFITSGKVVCGDLERSKSPVTNPQNLDITDHCSHEVIIDPSALQATDLSMINHQTQAQSIFKERQHPQESMNQYQKHQIKQYYQQIGSSSEQQKINEQANQEDASMVVDLQLTTQQHIKAPYRQSTDDLFANFRIVPQPVQGIPNAGSKPVLVFVNPRSGGNQGAKMMQKFNWLLNPRQVFDLIQSGGPRSALELYRNVPNLRILTIGGDGTASWILSYLDECGISNRIPVAVLPLGTGNDLARALGWGGGYTDEPIAKILTQVRDGEIVQLDRWNLHVERNLEAAPSSPNEFSSSSGFGCTSVAINDTSSPSITSSPSYFGSLSQGNTASTISIIDQTNCDTNINQVATGFNPQSNDESGSDRLPMDVINNYFSFGVDAHIALEFHTAREAHPERFNSRLRNKMFYGQAGGKDLLKRKWKDLSNFVTLYCDGQDMTNRLKELKVHSVLFLNIPSYGGGTRPWPTTATSFAKPRTDDGLIEVIGLTTYQLPLLQAGGHGTCIAQCRSAKIITSRTIPMQVDGEPCKLLPSIINISFKNRVCMLAKSKSSNKNSYTTTGNIPKIN